MPSRFAAMFAASLLSLAMIVLPESAAADPSTSPDVRRMGPLVLDGMPEIPSRLQDELRPYMSIRSAGFSGWHPDGQGILITTRFGETGQVHWVKEPLGQRRQLTFYNEPIGGVAVSPNPDVGGFLYTKDVGGGEAFQVFFYDLETGKSRLLSDGAARHGAPMWSRDGERFAYFSTRRNGRDWDIIAGTVQNGEEGTLWQGDGAWIPIRFSPTGDRLLLARFVSANESHPHVLDLETGKAEPFLPRDEKVSFGFMNFTPDGENIIFTSDADSEFKSLRRYHVASGEETVLSQQPWDAEAFDISPDGETVAYVVNADGSSELYLWRQDGVVDLSNTIPMGRINGLRFSPDGRHLGFQLNSPRTPGDVFSLNLETKELTRWTHSEIGGLNEEHFVEPTLIRYPTFDTVDGAPREIPSFYYKPEGDGPFPVVIRIHGGPEGQSRPTFDALMQYWIRELGVAVLVPNVRGSSGYGKSYLKMDNGRLREDSVADIGALLDWIETRPELDSERVATMGGSYGGYMVLASLVHYSDRVRAAIDVVGISNFVTFLRNTKSYRRDLRRAEYGDEREPGMEDFLESISPANHADKMKSPLFIVQGKNDPRVPVTESEQMVAELRQQGKDVWYLMAEDEGHGFRKQSNREVYNQSVVLFLQRYLLSSSLSERPTEAP